MTWREAIEQAMAGVTMAEAERARVLRAAHDAGLSTRDIATVAGVGHSTVWRWIGGAENGAPGPSLDAEVEPSLWGRSGSRSAK